MTSSTDISCIYDFFANQRVLNNLNEHDLHEQISSVCKHEEAYTIADFDTLSDNINITDRIKFYLDVVSSKLSSFDDIQKTLDVTIGQTDLNSRPTNIYIQDGNFSTQTTRGTQVWREWNILTSFWNQSTNLLKPNSRSSSTIQDFQCLAKYLVNDLSAFSTRTYSHKVLAPSESQKSKALIYVSDFLTEIHSFARILEQIKHFQFAVKLKTTQINTEVNAETQEPSKNSCDIMHSGMSIACIVQGPYQVIPQTIEDTVLYPIKPGSFYKDNILDFTGIVKLSDARANTLQSFPLNDEGSNGVLSYYNYVDETSFDLVTKLNQFEQQLGVMPGKVMSRKNMLKLIDLIFFTWATNLQKLSYTCNICHSNCHNNNIVLQVDSRASQREYSCKINRYLSGKGRDIASIRGSAVKSGSTLPPASTPYAKLAIKASLHSGSITTITIHTTSLGDVRLNLADIKSVYKDIGDYHRGEDITVIADDPKSYSMCVFTNVHWTIGTT